MTDAQTRDTLSLFAPGPSTSAAIISLHCPACVRELGELMDWVAQTASERRLIVLIDGPEGVPQLELRAGGVRITYPAGPVEVEKLWSDLLVPTRFTTDSLGQVVEWRPGVSP